MAGNLCNRDWKGIENCIGRSAGTCMTMGTASTMACVTEAMGFSLPGAACTPAVVAGTFATGDSDRPSRRRHGLGTTQAVHVYDKRVPR